MLFNNAVFPECGEETTYIRMIWGTCDTCRFLALPQNSLRVEPGIYILTPITLDNSYTHQRWRSNVGFNDIPGGVSMCYCLFKMLCV